MCRAGIGTCRETETRTSCAENVAVRALGLAKRVISEGGREGWRDEGEGDESDADGAQSSIEAKVNVDDFDSVTTSGIGDVPCRGPLFLRVGAERR